MENKIKYAMLYDNVIKFSYDYMPQEPNEHGENIRVQYNRALLEWKDSIKTATIGNELKNYLPSYWFDTLTTDRDIFSANFKEDAKLGINLIDISNKIEIKTIMPKLNYVGEFKPCTYVANLPPNNTTINNS